VYSTGDLGKRLHWIYWVPDETVADLDGLFEVKWVVDWDGEAWTYEAGEWAADGADVGWTQPISWEDYDDGTYSGVIGSLGFAWWATDDDALPGDTDGNAYNETDQDDIDALRASVLQAQTYATGMVRYKDGLSSEWQYTSIQLNVVPIPSAIWLLGSAFIGFVGFRRKFRK